MEERRLILEMLKDGKISAEEAKELLEALGENANEYIGNDDKIRPDKREYTEDKGGWSFFDGLKSLISFGDIAGPTHEFIEEYTHKFITNQVTADIRTKSGSIIIKTWEREDCSIKVTKKVRGISDEDRAREFAQSYQVLKLSDDAIHTEDYKNKQLSISYEIMMPKNVVLVLRSTSVNGKVNLKDLHVTSGKINTVNGKIIIDEVVGDKLSISGVNGLIDLNTSVNDLNCTTVNGKISMKDTNKNEGTIKLSTVNGPIKVALPKDVTGVRIHNSSVNGRIKVDHPELRIVSQSGKYVNKSSEVVSSGPIKREYNVSAVNGVLTVCEIESL